MHKTIDTACVIITDLLGLCVCPAIEELVFRLCELRSYGRFEHRFASVGLKSTTDGVSGLQTVIDQASGLLLKFEELRKTTVTARRNFAAFFLWLDACSNNLSDDRDESQPVMCPALDVDRIIECIRTEFVTDSVGDFLIDPTKPRPPLAAVAVAAKAASAHARATTAVTTSVTADPPLALRDRWAAANSGPAPSALRGLSKALIERWSAFAEVTALSLSPLCSFDSTRSFVAFSPVVPASPAAPTASSSIANSPHSSAAGTSAVPSGAASILNTPATDRRPPAGSVLFTPTTGGGSVPPVPLFSPLLSPAKPAGSDGSIPSTPFTTVASDEKSLSSSNRQTPNSLAAGSSAAAAAVTAPAGVTSSYNLALNPSALSPSLIAMSCVATPLASPESDSTELTVPALASPIVPQPLHHYFAVSGIDAQTACPFIVVLMTSAEPHTPVSAAAGSEQKSAPASQSVRIATLVFPSLIGRQLALQQSRKSAAAGGGGGMTNASPKPVSHSLSLGNPIVSLSFYKNDTLAVLVRTEEPATPVAPTSPSAEVKSSTATGSTVCSRMWFVEVGESKLPYESLPSDVTQALLSGSGGSGAGMGGAAVPSILQFAAQYIRLKYPNRKQLIAVAASPAPAPGSSPAASVHTTPIKSGSSVSAIPTASPGTGSLPFAISQTHIAECGLLGSRRTYTHSVLRQRDLSHTYARSVDIGKRGIGAVLCGTRRLLLFDVEDHELIAQAEAEAAEAAAAAAAAAAEAEADPITSATPIKELSAGGGSRSATPSISASGRRTPGSGTERKYTTPQHLKATVTNLSPSAIGSGGGGGVSSVMSPNRIDSDGDSTMN